MEIEQTLINAMSQVIPRAAARKIFDQSFASVSLESLSPDEWVTMIKGPLHDALSQAIPIRGVFRPFENLINEIKTNMTAEFEPLTTLESNVKIEYINLQSASDVERLVQDLAKMDDILGVIVEGPAGKESRLPGFGELSADIMKVANHLLKKKGAYRIFYSIWDVAQVVIRPLGSGWVAVVGKKQANLGHILYRLNHLEADSTA